MKLKRTSDQTLKLTLGGIFAALVVIFQLISYTYKIGEFGMTVTLVPVVLGGALLGIKGGAALGGVFGVVVSICSIVGLDGGGNILFGTNPPLTLLVCLAKGVAAGAVAALIYKLTVSINSTLAAILSSAIAPIVNTGLFVASMFVFFKSTLAEWAGGTDVLVYTITVLVGINFIIEFALGILLSPLVLAVIRAVSKTSRFE